MVYSRLRRRGRVGAVHGCTDQWRARGDNAAENRESKGEEKRRGGCTVASSSAPDVNVKIENKARLGQDTKIPRQGTGGSTDY